jgi:triosephosphate isomerase
MLIAANWKMHPAPAGAFSAGSPYGGSSAVDVWVFPSFLDIAKAVEAKLFTGAQCGHWEEKGAHTGDIAMPMLAAAGCRSVLCGHSERRAGYGETDEQVIEQVIAALEHGLHPILCVGETAAERKAGKQETVVRRQLKGCPTETGLTIAYEPVWAIGTGKTATPKEAQEMHAFIRSLLPKDIAGDMRILYGGSIKPENAEALFAQPDIDGGLVGGASIDPDAFRQIVHTAASSLKNS